MNENLNISTEIPTGQISHLQVSSSSSLSLNENFDKSSLKELAKTLNKLGLKAPAIFFLEAHLPLRSLVFNLSLITEPFLKAALGQKFINFKQALSSPESIEFLIKELESGCSQTKS